MLHLQLAANMATAIGVTPSFTDPALQDKNHGWICYGPAITVIPHVIDLKDTREHKGVFVNLGPVSADQLKLFLAIEEPEKEAKDYIDPDKISKYFPTVPFQSWAAGDPLPMFGTIGYMYQCYKDYLEISYTGGTTLWDAVFTAGAQQNDLFNSFVAGGHPMREFMGFEATVALTYPDIAKQQVVNMMNAISDQGEGATLKLRSLRLRRQNLLAVQPNYQSSDPALKSDYPSYNDIGGLVAAADAAARFDNDKMDHYERFQRVQATLGDIVTWPQWLAAHGPWRAEDLQASDYHPNGKHQLPSTAETAAALNSLAQPGPGVDNYKLVSQAGIGAIAGVTTVLDQYWNAEAQSKSPVSFPMPSMYGSGDRLAICWAVFGKAPDLSIGLDPPQPDKLYHACQSLDFDVAGGNTCAEVAIFHTCRGSNGCRAQGGCGFVQPIAGGGSCSTSTVVQMRSFGAGCNPFAGPDYSAPSDNRCMTFGGCAVPISAYQLFPKSGTMQLFDFEKQPDGSYKPVEIPNGKVLFRQGQKVHDVAYSAYKTVMQHRGKTVPADPPGPLPLRLAFPPST